MICKHCFEPIVEDDKMADLGLTWAHPKSRIQGERRGVYCTYSDEEHLIGKSAEPLGELEELVLKGDDL